MKKTYLNILILAMVLISSVDAYSQTCCSKSKGIDKDSKTSIAKMVSSEYALLDHNGNERNLKDVIKDKVVIMNFIFTSCKTICPPMGANFAALKEELGDRADENLIMLSVSIDPSTDTPERLKAWKENFDSEDAEDKWTLLTGSKATVDQLLKDLEVFTPLINEHAPIIIMGYANDTNWIRTNGLASPDVLVDKAVEYIEIAKAAMDSPDRDYFTDLELIDQNGESFRFYSDLLRDKVVFINPFFAECTGSCPIMHTMMKDVQNHLGDKLGTSVVMLSITVDPVNDTPDKLKDYAALYEAKEGWHFLSGSVNNVNDVMKKIGKYVPEREQHDAIILIGNMQTKLWKKTNGLANVTEIIEVLDSVINDEGDSE